jgi:hypothetical protein
LAFVILNLIQHEGTARVKNEFFLMVDTVSEQNAIVRSEDKAVREFRSEGQANSEGRRLINTGLASKYRILKTVSEQN